MRVVLDTNIIIYGLLFGGVPRKLIQLCTSRPGLAITSEALVDELRDVLERTKFERYIKRLNRTPEDLVKDYLTYTSVIEPVHIEEGAVRDVKDTIVLEAAVGGKATYIVSGDNDLLVLRTYAGITILSAADVLLLIETDENDSG
ncbi:MAG: putative toxin-antitoxin system toxin component, PIN family [Chloroflexota bacterium]